MTYRRHVTFVIVVAMAMTAIALAQETQKSLFDRLGGRAGITAVVDDFVANCAADTRINRFFAETAKDPKRMAMFKGHLVDQLCEATGGPCKYTGKNMRDAHRGMGISSADFDALVEDLVKSLTKFKVSAADQKTLLGVLGPMKADMVEKK